MEHEIEFTEAYEDDDFTDVTLEDEPEDDRLAYDPDAVNIVPDLAESARGRAAIKSIAERVKEDFDRDWESTEEYRERCKNDWKLFSGELPPKTFPFEDCANAHVPIMLETIARLSFRIQAELFGDWTNVFGVVPVGTDDKDMAEVLTRHGNWQIREQIVDFPRQMDRAMLAYLVWGDVTAHSYWDPTMRRNRHETLTPDDFVVPYAHVSTMPDYSDLPHYTKVLYRYPHEIEDMVDVWHEVDELLRGEPSSWDDEPEALFRDGAGESAGITPPDDDPTAPYKLLQYEGWLKLPDQARHRWVQVIMDYESERILSVQILEQEDWQDRTRYDRQLIEWQAYQASREEWQTAQEGRATAVEQILADPKATDEVKQAVAQQVADEPPPEQPQPPAWWDGSSEGPEPVRMVPLRMFSHGVCIENMAGSLGLSFGRIEADFNRGANIALSQFVDAATLANAWTLLVADEVDLEDMSFSPGAVNKVKGVSGTDLRNAIMEMRPGPANGQLVEIAERLYNWGQSAIQAPAVLSGEPGKSGETYRGLAARIEQATKQVSVAARKFANQFLRQVLCNNATLNAMFLDDMEVIQVMDRQQQMMQTLRVGSAMYRRNYQVEIRADLRFTSETQRIQEAMELVQFPAAMPALQGNLAFLHAAAKRYLEARKDYDLVPLLGPPPPPPETPMGVPPPQPSGAPQQQGGQPPQGPQGGGQ